MEASSSTHTMQAGGGEREEADARYKVKSYTILAGRNRRGADVYAFTIHDHCMRNGHHVKC